MFLILLDVCLDLNVLSVFVIDFSMNFDVIDLESGFVLIFSEIVM